MGGKIGEDSHLSLEPIKTGIPTEEDIVIPELTLLRSTIGTTYLATDQETQKMRRLIMSISNTLCMLIVFPGRFALLHHYICSEVKTKHGHQNEAIYVANISPQGFASNIVCLLYAHFRVSIKLFLLPLTN